MNAKSATGCILGAIFLVIFIVLLVPYALSWPPAAPVPPTIGAALWKGRTYEALLQGLIILAGVLSILLLLGLKQAGRTPP